MWVNFHKHGKGELKFSLDGQANIKTIKNTSNITTASHLKTAEAPTPETSCLFYTHEPTKSV